ncbi:MAG: DUF2752 domain-containing protein [Gemmataceae bacterium]|nr:DUF2752 domain-containing protein [Gemmataceae bacterium]
MTPNPPHALSPWFRRLVRGTILVFAVLGVAAGVYVLAAVPPTDDSFYPRCQLHSTTGLHCPGCGTTRALHALLNGRVEQALAFNPLAFVAVPIIGWSLVKSLRMSYLGRPVRRPSARYRYLPWVLVSVLLLFAVLRNLPWHPFTLLAPHAI